MFKSLFILVSIFSGVLAKAEPIKLKWVLAHEPSRVFARAAKTFGDRLSEKTNGGMVVEIVDSKTISANGSSSDEVYQKVKSGEIQMSQTYTTSLGNHDKSLWTLDLPFLFRDHKHAAKVLDGALGNQMLAGLEPDGVKGLSFTYSGGFRIISTIDHPLNRLADFKGQKIRVVNDSPIAAAYIKSLGAIPVYSTPMNKASGGIETTYARLEVVKDDTAKYLNETEHSLFLTAIIINKKFFDSLSPEYQKAMKEVALETAKIEREDSIQDGLLARKKFVEGGMVLVKMNADEQEKLKFESKKVYSQFYGLLDKKLIAAIQND